MVTTTTDRTPGKMMNCVWDNQSFAMEYQGYRTEKRFDQQTQNYTQRKFYSRRKGFKNNFERDLVAMKQVWKMLQEGSIRWLGEVGRRY